MIFVGIGSNLGDSEKLVLEAVSLMEVRSQCQVIALSPWYLTEPVGFTDQPWFVNGMVKVKSSLSPLQLLHHCQSIEHKLKRVTCHKWGPRTIDLDIVLWEDRVYLSNELKIPHPQMHLRRFVLLPLKDIAPHNRHPLLGKSITELEMAVKDYSIVKPLRKADKEEDQ